MEQVRQSLMAGRYVDDKGKPLSYDAEYPYVKHPYQEFKMMPIYLSLLVDERKLPRLLVEFANSNMPIETKRVRVRKVEVSAAEMAGGERGAGGPMASGSLFRNDPGSQKEEVGAFDVPVELFGVIYIYEPPDREKLGVPAQTDAAAPAQPGNQPPATPPANTAQPAKP
jgi:hypothetical protein